MKTYYCDISKFNEDIESFVIAKNKIESNMKLLEELNKKMTVNEFLAFATQFKNTYIYEGIPLSFTLYRLINDDVVILYAITEDKTEAIESFKSDLKKIGYELENLQEISYTDLIGQGIETPYFTINGIIYQP